MMADLSTSRARLTFSLLHRLLASSTYYVDMDPASLHARRNVYVAFARSTNPFEGFFTLTGANPPAPILHVHIFMGRNFFHTLCSIPAVRPHDTQEAEAHISVIENFVSTLGPAVLFSPASINKQGGLTYSTYMQVEKINKSSAAYLSHSLSRLYNLLYSYHDSNTVIL